MNERVDSGGPSWADTGFVLLSGPAPWWGSERGALAERLGALSMFAWSFITAVTMLTLGEAVWPDTVLVIVGMTVFWLPVVRWANGARWTFGRNPLALIPLRTAAAALCAVGFLLSDVPLLLAALLSGLVAGADASVSLRGIGLQLRPHRALVRFALSPIHLGVLIGLGAAFFWFDRADLETVLVYYGVMWFTIGMIVLTISWFDRIERIGLAERAALERKVKAEQHRSRAHWIHDDVCSELRFIRMKVEQDSMDGPELLDALADLDHRLRLRQLDEQVDSGHVRIAEVVQPFVRTLQDRGVDVLDVPPYDVANTPLSPSVARTLRHALSVLVTNAINAGAGSVSIRCSVSDAGLSVEVEDDAGGFSLQDIPAGRSLDGLRHELASSDGRSDGRPPLEVEPTADGSRVRVRVPIEARS